MTSPIEPRTASLYHASPGGAVEPRIAAAIVLAAMASFLMIAAVVPPDIAMLAAQAMLAAIPLGAVVIGRVGQPLAALGLGGAPPRLFAAATAIGTSAWYVNMRLVAYLPLPEHQTRALAQLVDRPSLARALVTFALAPAVCEELLFRGILARSLGRRLPLAGAAAISAVVFALYHLSVVQALPTLTLGFALAVLAIRADSVLPAIVAHLLNNALAIAISRGELPAIAGWLGRHPSAAFAGCATATGLGLAAALRRSR